MKIRTDELKVGDVFYFHYYEKDFPCEVVDTPFVYSAETLKKTRIVIIDYWVDEKRHEQIKLPDNEMWDVIYRRNTEYETLYETVKKYRKNEDKTEENKQ